MTHRPNTYLTFKCRQLGCVSVFVLLCCVDVCVPQWDTYDGRGWGNRSKGLKLADWSGMECGRDSSLARPSYLTSWFRKTSWLHVFAAVDGLVGWKREHFKSTHVKAQRFWQWTTPHFHVKIKMKVKVKFPRFTTFQTGVQSCSCATLPQLASVYITERQH